MDMIRQAALAGFIALDEVSAFRELPDWQPEKKISLDVFTLDNNRQILTYIAKHWDRLTAALGPHLLERLGSHGANEWWLWDHLAPYISESSARRVDFLSYCSRSARAYRRTHIGKAIRRRNGNTREGRKARHVSTVCGHCRTVDRVER
jgi:hypothetical protein